MLVVTGPAKPAVAISLRVGQLAVGPVTAISRQSNGLTAVTCDRGRVPTRFVSPSKSPPIPNMHRAEYQKQEKTLSWTQAI